MGLYEDQLAKIQRTEDFLQRQIDLSDNNQSDVIEALLTNTWGTTNTFEIDGQVKTTGGNLKEYLIQEGFDTDVGGNVIIPDYVDRSIWNPIKNDATRYISSIIPKGSGGSLTEIQKAIDSIKGDMPTLNETTYITNQRDLNPVQEDIATQDLFEEARTTIENDPLLNDEQKRSTLTVFGILLMMVGGS